MFYSTAPSFFFLFFPQRRSPFLCSFHTVMVYSNVPHTARAMFFFSIVNIIYCIIKKMSKGSFDSRTQENVLQEARNTDDYVKRTGKRPVFVPSSFKESSTKKQRSSQASFICYCMQLYDMYICSFARMQ